MTSPIYLLKLTYSPSLIKKPASSASQIHDADDAVDARDATAIDNQ
jgi:hypothetical protein